MADHSAKSVEKLLSGNHSQLSAILDKVQLLNALNERVIPLIEEHLRPYCQVANIKQQKLTLIVANGAIATQIRFQTSTLLRKFKQDELLSRITGINCKVNPDFKHYRSDRLNRKDSNENKVEKLSSQTSGLVASIAETLSFPGLRDALKRIASRKK